MLAILSYLLNNGFVEKISIKKRREKKIKRKKPLETNLALNRLVSLRLFYLFKAKYVLAAGNKLDVLWNSPLDETHFGYDIDI